MRSSNYRPDIDGLRTIAVLSVVFFHFGWTWVPGGYVGVDIFFVISGFLITGLIRQEVLATGSFRFARFYIRRMRRLFPALFVTLAGCIVAAYIFFPPVQMEKFGGEVAASILSVSNFYFHLQSGYFDTEAILKPLLHTWSLSVEEQFYLLWPLLIFLALKRTGDWSTGVLLVVAGELSLLAALFFAVNEMNGFFLTPLRVFEFAIGGALVWLTSYRARNNATLEAMLVTGLVMIAASILLFDEETVFPGVAALLPCIGAALCIYAGTARYTGLVLRNRLCVSIGLISYSLYLVHWPIVVFYNYTLDSTDIEGNAFNAISFPESLALLALMLALAVLMYRFVERPFREGAYKSMITSNGIFVGGAAFAALLTAGAGVNASTSGGWMWRLSEREAALAELNAESRSLPTSSCQYRGPEEAKKRFAPCVQSAGKGVVVFGDSHGSDLFHALAWNLPDLHVIGLTRGNCRIADPKDPKNCLMEEIVDFIDKHRDQLKAVIYTQIGRNLLLRVDGKLANPDEPEIKVVAAFLDRVATLGVPVYWVGPQLEPNIRVDKMPAAQVIFEQAKLLEKQLDMSVLDQTLERLSEGHRYTYVSKVAAQSRVQPNYLAIDGKLTYVDATHWSQFGAALFGGFLLEDNQVFRQALSAH